MPNADPWIPKGRWTIGQLGQKTTKEGSEEAKGAENEKQGSEMEVVEATPGTQPSSNETDGFATCEVDERHEGNVEVQGPKRRVIRVESEETQDYVRETLAADNRCSNQAVRFLQIASMVIEEGGEARTFNLCKLCYNAKLVQQVKQPLNSKEWGEVLEKKHHERNMKIHRSRQG